MTADQEAQEAQWSVAEWHGRMLIDSDGEKIGKLQTCTSTSRPMIRSSPRSRKASSTAT